MKNTELYYNPGNKKFLFFKIGEQFKNYFLIKNYVKDLRTLLILSKSVSKNVILNFDTVELIKLYIKIQKEYNSETPSFYRTSKKAGRVTLYNYIGRQIDTNLPIQALEGLKVKPVNYYKEFLFADSYYGECKRLVERALAWKFKLRIYKDGTMPQSTRDFFNTLQKGF